MILRFFFFFDLFGLVFVFGEGGVDWLEEGFVFGVSDFRE